MEQEQIYKITNSGKIIPIAELIRCKNCKHRPEITEPGVFRGFSLEFPDYVCPCNCDDGYYSWYPDDNWFCANGEQKDGEQE